MDPKFKGEKGPGQPPRTPEAKEEIPLSWFVAVGTRMRGQEREDIVIDRVRFSNEFMNLEARAVFGYLQQYILFSRGIRDFSLIKDEHDRRKATDADKFIRQITHFGAQEIIDKKEELESKYKGSKSSPLQFIIERGH